MKQRYGWLAVMAAVLAGCTAQAQQAPNAFEIFSPADVRLTSTGTSAAKPLSFNSSTLNMTCSTGPVTAVISSTPDGTGNVLVDNFLKLSVTAGGATTGPVNLCSGGQSESGGAKDCFTASYQTAANAKRITGVNPDTIAATGGIPPIDISSQLPLNTPLQVTVSLVDIGGYLAGSSIYLVSNCTQSGVSGPAKVTGNPIPSNNPSPDQLKQPFTFDPTVNQQVQFVYDLTASEANGNLSIQDGTIPNTTDTPLDSVQWQPTYVAGTSFATSSCHIHDGERLPGSGNAACKLYTLECQVGTGANQSGAQCPVSTASDEIFQDVFDGPAFTLPDITNPGGPTFHEGIGFLMASEGWTGGACGFDPNSGLQNQLCPQNLLTDFEGPGLYASGGRGTHPNSTFISVYGVPEDLTTVTVAGLHAGNWINTRTATVNFSSQPPVVPQPNNNFVAAPIQSITYGVSAAALVPPTKFAVPGDVVVTNPAGCPTPANPGTPAAATFATDPQTVSFGADGSYALHYFAQDCAGTEELKFTQDGGGAWSTSFYTVPVNVDTVAPTISAVTLSPLASTNAGGTYTQNQPVSVSFSCSDDNSGVVNCGGTPFSTGVPSTGGITIPVDTSTLGPKTVSLTATDAAGNVSAPVSFTYTVAASAPTVNFTLSATQATFPNGATATVNVAYYNGHQPLGRIHVYDSSSSGGAVVGILSLDARGPAGSGIATGTISGLSVGTHTLTAVYEGDAYIPGGTSQPLTLTVLAAPVTLTDTCTSQSIVYGASETCTISAAIASGAAIGTVTYQLDAGATGSASLVNGVLKVAITRPAGGTHTLTSGFAAQTNYLAATPAQYSFVVTAAPLVLTLKSSSSNVTGGSFTLQAGLKGTTTGTPVPQGTVTFLDGNNPVGTGNIGTNGIASLTLPAVQFTNGVHTFTATYAANANYQSASGSVNVTVNLR